jgi:hypothetical protein
VSLVEQVAKTIASLDSFLKWMHALEKNGHLLPPSLTPAVDTEQPIDADEEPSQNPEVINAVSAQAEHSATDSSSNVNAAERAWLHAVDAESVLPPMPSQLPSEGIEQLESNQLTVDDLFINRLDDDEDEYGKEIKEAWRLVEMAERRLRSVFVTLIFDFIAFYLIVLINSMGVSVDDEEGAELREALAAELQETSNNLNESFASSARSSRVASVRASPLTYRKVLDCFLLS